MSAPLVRVFVGFNTVDYSANPFQLDDPVYGILDTGTLASTELFDLTSLVQSVNISRGRSRQLDQFNAGSAVIYFDNSTRVLDPLNEDSIYYPFVLPRVPVQVTANGITIFYGFVVDWNLDYDKTGQDTMVAVCSDDFALFANQFFDDFTPAAELSGDRVLSVLARPEVDYQGTRQVSTGSLQLGAYAVTAGTNVLNYLQLIAKSEQGFLYTSANGVFTFKGKDDLLTVDPDFLFSDDGTGIPYQTLINQFGDELLYNYIVTESPAGGPFIANDLDSQVKYQYQQLSLTDLLNSSSQVVESIGLFLLSKYKEPLLRFAGLSTQLAGLPSDKQDICLSIDLTDFCSVKKSFATGTPSSVTQDLLVSGVNHVIVPGSHIVNFTFEKAEKVVVFGASSDVVADGYRIVTFENDGSIVAHEDIADVEYLIVGGGGGGGGSTGNGGGGGGAGGLITNVGSAVTLTADAYPVVVGAGGSGGPANIGGNGTSGSDSSFNSLTAVGGGLGRNPSTVAANRNGLAGGSGGGGAGSGTAGGTGGAGTAGQGNAGGAGSVGSPGSGGGGGGAGSAGGSPITAGTGVSNSITGSAVTYAVGGTGGSAATAGAGANGTDGRGNGGGGAGGATAVGGNGGDGIVIVRWPV